MTFSFFFGIVGLVIGGIVVWFLLAEHPFEAPEVRGGPVDGLEISLLAGMLAQEGQTIDEAAIARLLELHSAYFDGRMHGSAAEAELARLEFERSRALSEMARD